MKTRKCGGAGHLNRIAIADMLHRPSTLFSAVKPGSGPRYSGKRSISKKSALSNAASPPKTDPGEHRQREKGLLDRRPPRDGLMPLVWLYSSAHGQGISPPAPAHTMPERLITENHALN